MGVRVMGTTRELMPGGEFVSSPSGSRSGPAFLLRPRDFLVGEFLESGVVAGVFDGHADEVAMAVKVNVNIFADLPGLGRLLVRKLEQGRIRVREIFYSHYLFSLATRGRLTKDYISAS